MLAFLTCRFSNLVSEAVIFPRLGKFSCSATQEFRRTEAKSDAAAYSNLENIRCGSVDSSLGSFLTMWENLMLTFRTPPSDDHLFSVFTNCIKHIPGIATTMALLKRIPYGHMNKNILFLKEACLALVEEIRMDRQLA